MSIASATPSPAAQIRSRNAKVDSQSITAGPPGVLSAATDGTT